MTLTTADTQLRYAFELTSADVNALKAFVLARIAEVKERHRFGSVEHDVAHCLTRFVEDGFQSLDEAFLYGDDSREVLGIKRDHWSRLILATMTWREHPDYNAARWRRPDYRDAAHEQEMIAYHRSQLR
ncbi:hypothetical protein [Streptomyces hydrogenans]|uniref:hypothetical protein n=1 Tax=Streptomyces hydrogenans TaxID=1873719 RepID=UPI00342FB13E